MKFTKLRETLIFDIETDGLNPSKIHCMSYHYLGETKSTTNYEEMKTILTKDVVLVGHNIALYDIPALEKLLSIKIGDNFVDTLALSWFLYPKRLRHGLEDWGVELGKHKVQINDWENLTTEEYIERCEGDVLINLMLYEKMLNDLNVLYRGDEENLYRFIEYLTFKMDCVREQHKYGWKIDEVKIKEHLKELQSLANNATEELIKAMPKIPVSKVVNKPKKMFLVNGKLSKAGKEWVSLSNNDQTIETITLVNHYEEPNPNSVQQVKNWLFSLGWKPTVFKYTINSAGKEVKIPQVSIKTDEGPKLCDDILRIAEENPDVKHLDRLSLIKSRINILKSFLTLSENGVITASVNGLTNTLRFKHKNVVNLPAVDKLYGEYIRGVLLSGDGFTLVGSDMCSLEDTTKKHYMFQYDPDYVNEMSKEGFDPHLDLALSAGAVTQEDLKKYKEGDKQVVPIVKAIRKIYKTVNYASVYGAGAKTIARGAGISVKEAKALIETYWKRNAAVLKVASTTKTKRALGETWLYNPVSKFWVNLRTEKDIFSTLNQSTGVFCFDTWLSHVRKRRKQLTAQFHDEIVLCIKEGKIYEEKCRKLLLDAIEDTNNQLNLNVKLNIDIQFGKNYAQIH